jgi:hypothetical protein
LIGAGRRDLADHLFGRGIDDLDGLAPTLDELAAYQHLGPSFVS